MSRVSLALVSVVMAPWLAACSSTAVPGPGAEGPAPARSTENPETASAARAGPYTVEQAARGEALFADVCSSCHETSRFSGGTFIVPWSRSPLSMLFGFVRTNMPRGDPGSLSREQYADVVAYLLALNDIPAGSSELPSDGPSLAQIRVEAPAR